MVGCRCCEGCSGLCRLYVRCVLSVFWVIVFRSFGCVWGGEREYFIMGCSLMFWLCLVALCFWWVDGYGYWSRGVVNLGFA